ncbi:MAG: hypothetical protein RLZZ352_230 [Pseudomonadota bacterium]|jgi:hypothetical protein
MTEFLRQAWDWILTINFKGDLLPWLPPIVTLLGWWVVNRQNNQRETRKEARSAADRCKVLAREVSQYGIEYWSCSANVEPWKIRAAFEELEVEIERFQDKGMQKRLLDLQVELVEAVMGYNFDTAGFKPVAQDHPVFKEIPIARQRLLSSIERELALQFR